MRTPAWRQPWLRTAPQVQRDREKRKYMAPLTLGHTSTGKWTPAGAMEEIVFPTLMAQALVPRQFIGQKVRVHQIPLS